MANILRNIDKIRTTAGTEVDLDNIQATGGSSGGSAGLEGSGISYSVNSDGDEVYEAGNSSEVIALNINNPQDGDGLFYDAASQTWVNKVQITSTGGVISEVLINGKNWKVHVFEEGEDFTISANKTVEYLLIGGGGSGGSYYGGGGGAGEFQVGTFNAAANEVYSISIGAGGASTLGTTAGNNGSPSTIIGTNVSLNALGGGGGGSHNASAGDGGSGGGGGTPSQTGFGNGGSGLAGNDGGSGYHLHGDNVQNGGGGGAGTKGMDATSGMNVPTDGGDGLLNNWLGQDYYWCGGGGGGTGKHGSGGDGGRGGGGGAVGASGSPVSSAGADAYKAGGNGGNNPNADRGGDGGENTGSGGGGSIDSSSSTTYSGSGGKGICIIRY